MQDRASFMSVSDMPILRQIENTDLVTRSYPTQSQTQQQSRVRKQSFNLITPEPATQISSSVSLSGLSSIQNQPDHSTNLFAYNDDTNSNNQSEDVSRSLSSFSPNPIINLKDVTPILSSNATSKKSLQQLKSLSGEPASKHDTRIVNEAFQDAVQMLESGFSSKMQAEMLVLVDVLHKPAAIFPRNSSFRIKSQDKRFIGK